MIKVLITGGAGFIGSSVAEKLLSIGGYEVVIADNLLTGKKSNIPVHPNCRFVHCDVNRYDHISAVMTACRFDYVFHYAAVVGVQRTLQNPALVLQDIEGIKNVLELSRITGVKRVFYSSSSEVYGEPVELPQHEYTTPLNSRLPYSVVKNIGESYCRTYHQEYGLDYTIFRFFNTYGPKQSSDFVMSKFLKAALSGQDITIYGDGSQSRTFCYIDDNVDACIWAMMDQSCANEVYNIGSDEVITIADLAETIITLTKSTSRIVHLPPLKEGDMSKRQPDNKRMIKLLGRDPIPYEFGIRRMIGSKTITEAANKVTTWSHSATNN